MSLLGPGGKHAKHCCVFLVRSSEERDLPAPYTRIAADTPSLEDVPCQPPDKPVQQSLPRQIQASAKATTRMGLKQWRPAKPPRLERPGFKQQICIDQKRGFPPRLRSSGSQCPSCQMLDDVGLAGVGRLRRLRCPRPASPQDGMTLRRPGASMLNAGIELRLPHAAARLLRAEARDGPKYRRDFLAQLCRHLWRAQLCFFFLMRRLTAAFFVAACSCTGACVGGGLLDKRQ